MRTRPDHPIQALVWVALVLAGCGGGGSDGVTNPDPNGNTVDGLRAFAAVAGDGQVVLEWRNPVASSFVRAIVRRKQDGPPASPTDGDPVYDGTDSTFTDTGLVNGATYHYAGFAEHLLQTSAPSVASARPLPPPPAAPGAFGASARTHAVRLSWQNPTSQNVVVRMATGAYPAWGSGAQVYAGTGGSTTVSDLQPEQTYYFSAWFVDGHGQRSSSPAQGNAAPLYEYQDIVIPQWSESGLCPAHPSSGAGDREFAGHGPRIIVNLSYERRSSTIYARLELSAREEPAGDGTYAASTWSWPRATIPAGWTFDSWVASGVYVDQTVNYLDSDHGVEAFGPYASSYPIYRMSVIGDTGGNDVGNCTSDDTQILSITANPRTFRVRR